MKHRPTAVCIILTAAILISLFSFSFATSAAVNEAVNTCALNMREAPAASSNVLCTLSRNTEITLLDDSSNGWIHVNANNRTGYVVTAYLSPSADSGVKMSGVTTADVNLREGRGTGSSVLTIVPEDTTVKVTDNSDPEWSEVEYNNMTGYISRDYIRVDFAIAQNTQPSTAATTQPTSASTRYRSVSTGGLPRVYQHSLTDDAVENACEIEELLLDKTSASIPINGKVKLTPYDYTDEQIISNIVFTSSNSGVAKVGADGFVRGVSAGSATIYAKNRLTGASASCKVTVTSTVVSAEPETAMPTVPPTQKPTQPATQAPTQPPTQAPTQPATQKPTSPSIETLSLSSTSLSVYQGCYSKVTATSNTTVTFTSSNTNVCSVAADGLIYARAVGSATITAKTATKTATCKVNVRSGSTVSISHTSATITVGKTFLMRSYTDSVSWSSTDTSICTVKNGYILANKAGRAVVTASTSSGAATCVVNVEPAAPIRFAYTSPNCAAKNQTITLIAITDTTRTAVRFVVRVGSNNVYVDASSKTKDGNTLIFKGTTQIADAGTYTVRAYSKTASSGWSTCDDGETTTFVANTADRKTTVCTERRASDEVIALIANFEGFISSIYDDPITGDPTVGYGRVIFSGQSFYNAMTKNEAYAYLVQTVNNDGYARKVNSFLIENKVKFNQQQFDALVCLVYNTGTGPLSSDTQLRSALLDCHDGEGGTVIYYINGSYVRIRKGPGTNYEIIKELEYNTTLKILSTSNSAWYQVQLSDGTKGYVSSDYISRRATGGNLDLNFVNRQPLINKFCAYHHAAGSCILGLLYRRVDEMEMFFYGDYDRNYGVYKYNINYTCSSNPSFHT